jgi:hypothetical protein
MSILDAVDQRVKDAGFNFVPFNRFLASPFQIPTDSPDSSDAAAAGIPAVYQSRPQGGGGGYFENLKPEDQRGFLGNFQNIDPNEMYSYTPQGIQMEGVEYGEPKNLVYNPTTKRFQPAFDYDAPSTMINEYIKPAPEIFEPQKQNMFQKVFDPIKDTGAKIFGGILSAATGVPFLGSALEGIAGQFENRPLGAAVIDEFGNVYSEEELNKQNALGGYYTDAARSARRRTKRIQNMLQRQAQNKKISLANLAKLQAQEKAQEEIRQAAAKALQDENRDRGRGGYQAAESSPGAGDGYDGGFMEGPSNPGADLTSTMGSFMNGGIVDLVDIYD